MHRWRLGPDILVETDSVPLARAIDLVYGRLRTAKPSAGNPPLFLAFDESLTIHCGGARVLRAESPSHLVPLVESMLDTFAGHVTRTKAVFHAGVLSVGGRGVLLSGESGAGKSTATLWLAQQGHEYFGDDLCFMDYETLSVEGLPKAATLKRGSFDLFPASEIFADPVRGPVRYLLPPRVAGAEKTTALNALIFPRYEKDSELRVSRIAKPLAALALVQQSFLGVHREPRKLELVARLAETPAWHVEYSRFADLERAVTEALA